MRLLRIFVLLLPLFLTACGLSDQQKADYARVQESGVSSAVYDKMIHGDELSLFDIKALTHAHVSDAIIIRYLRDQGSVYYLNTDDITSMRKAGVSQSIIDYMLRTADNNPPYSPYPYGYGYGYGPYWGDPFWGPYPYYGYGHFHHWH